MVREIRTLNNGEKVQVLDEQTSRKNWLVMARTLGCEAELRQIFTRYDNLLQNCRNPQERQAIAAMGIIEVSNLLDNGYLGIGGDLTVGGVKVKDSKDKKNE
jgi:hypothetical protein